MKHYNWNAFILKDVEVTSSFEGLINLEPSVLKDKSKDKTCFLKRLCDHTTDLQSGQLHLKSPIEATLNIWA